MPDPVVGAASPPAPKGGRWPQGGKRVRSNRTIPPRPDFDIDQLPGSAKLTAHEVASVLRVTPGTVYGMCGDDVSDPYRPLHPVNVRGKKIISVANLRQVLANGIPRKEFKRRRKAKK